MFKLKTIRLKCGQAMNPTKVKRAICKLTGWVLFFTVLVWSLGVQLIQFAPWAGAASVDAIADVLWQDSQATIAVQFSNWAFNSASPIWGPDGALVAADFKVTSDGTTPVTINSVTHDGGSRIAVLTLASTATSGFTVACADSASVYYDNGDNCDGTVKILGGGVGEFPVESSAFAVNSVEPMGNTVEVEFNHPVAGSATAINKLYYYLLTKDSGMDGFGDVGNSTYTALNATAVDNDTNVMVANWSPSVVNVEAWNADINPSRGDCVNTPGDCDKIKIGYQVSDIWGNQLGIDVNDDVEQSIKFDASGNSGAPMIEGVFVDDGKIVDTGDGTLSTSAGYDTVTIVFSEDMEETSAENASFYTLKFNVGGDCDFSNDVEVTSSNFFDNKVVRVSDAADNNKVRFSVSNDPSTGYNIVGHDPSNPDPNVCSSSVKVVGGSWATDGPKDLDGNIQEDDWDMMIEAATVPTIQGVSFDTTTKVLRITFSKFMDVNTINTSAFTVNPSTESATKDSAILDWDQRTVILALSGTFTIVDGATLVVSDAIKDLLGQSVPAGAPRTYTFSTAALLSPTITKVKVSDGGDTAANANGQIDINDKVAIIFSKNMDKMSAWDPWAFDLLGGPNCTITDPSIHADKNNCDQWGYWGDGTALAWGDIDTDGSEADSLNDGCDTGGTPGNNNCAVITVGQYSNVQSNMKIVPWVDSTGQSGVSDTSGNTVSNVFALSTASATITNVIVNPIAGGATPTTLDVSDTVTFFFSKDMDANSVNADGSDVDVRMAAADSVPNPHTWGSSPGVAWGDQDADGSEGDGSDDGCDTSPVGGVSGNNCLIITLGGSPNIINDDTITPHATLVLDTNGNAVSNIWTIKTSGPGVTLISGRTKIKVVFTEPVANMNGLSYPDMRSDAPSYDAPSVDIVANVAAKFAFGGGSPALAAQSLDFVSNDGKTFIISVNRTAAINDDTLNVTALKADSGLTAVGNKVIKGGDDYSSNYSTDTNGFAAVAVAPTIESVDIMTGGGFGFMDTAGTGGGTTGLSPGTFVRIRFSQSMSTSSITNANINTALPATDAQSNPRTNPWGTAWTNVWWMSEGGFNNNVVEINVGDGATVANGDVVTPATTVTSESGVAVTGTFTLDTSMAGVDKMTYIDDNSPTGISEGDKLVFEFNKSMNTSADGFSVNGCNTPITATNLIAEMVKDSSSSWQSYPISAEKMESGWARRNQPFGTTGLNMVWDKTATGSCDKLVVTFGDSPTIADGDTIWFDPMWITTQSGKSLLTNDLTLDISQPTLGYVALQDSDADDLAGTTGDKLYFTFSKPIDINTINNTNIDTRLAIAGKDYGATPTLTWLSPTILEVTIANIPSSAIALTDAVVPTVDIKDLSGNSIVTPPSPSMNVETANYSPIVSNVILTDLQDTSNPGLDKNDMRVSFTEPSDISTVHHYNVYILSSDLSLPTSVYELSTDCINSASAVGGVACHRVNSSDILPVAAGGTITYNLSSSAYAIYDDSRFSYIADGVMPDSSKTFYPFMPEKSYKAYVVSCIDDILDDSCFGEFVPVGSTSINFTMQTMSFNFNDAMSKTGIGPAGGSGTTGITAGGDFWIEGTDPYPGAQDIPTNLTKLNIKFSQPLDESSISYTGTEACPTLCLRENISGTWTPVGADKVTASYDSDHFAITLKIVAGTLIAGREYEVKIAGASASINESSYGNLIKSSFGMAIPGDYYSNFTVGAGADTTAPQVIDDKFMAEGMDWYNGQAKTGSSTSPYKLDLSTRILEEIGVRFDKSMDPVTFSSSSVTLKYGGSFDISVSGSVDYDPFDRTAHFWLDSALPTDTNFKLTISGALVKDIAGNRLDGDRDGVAGGDYTLYFDTAGAMNVDAPEITWGDSDGFWLGIGFNQPMKESTVTNSSNWTLSTSTGAVSLSGASFDYDQFMNELHIEGLNIDDNATYTITAGSNIKGLNGTPLSTASTCANNNDGTQSNVSCSAFAGTAHGFTGKGFMDCADGFQFGCSSDDVFNPDVMNFMPIDAWPMTMVAGQPSRYIVNFPITQAIDHGGQVILSYPSGFDISGATIANKDTESFMNWDMNGPGTGIVRVRSIEGTATGGTATTLIDTTTGVLVDADDDDSNGDYNDDDDYNGYILFMTSGNNKNEYRVISDYEASTNTISLKSAFSNAVASGDTYEIQYVTRNALKNTITLILDIDEDEDGSMTDEAAITSTTMSNDFISFELKGIVNGDAAEMDWSSFPPKGGYTIDITSKNSTGKTLDGPLTSMPFEIKKAGPGIVSGYVRKTDGTTAIAGAKVFLDGPSGHLEKTSGSDGAFRFSGLDAPTTSGEEWYYWLMVEPPETGSYFQGNGVEVKLTSAATSVTGVTLKLKSGDSTISGKFLHENDLISSNQKVRIWASGPEGWIERELILDGNLAVSSSTRGAACDEVASFTTAELAKFTDPKCSEYIVDVMNGDWNISVEPFFATSTMTVGPPPEPAFTPPSPQLVTVSGSKIDVNFTLKSASLSITGSVVDTSGNGLSGVEVWAHNSTGEFGWGANSQTKADGTFKLKVAEGLYQIGVMIPGLPSQPEQGIDVSSGGNTPSSVTFTVTKPGTSVTGTVYDENFDPVQFAGVSAFNTATGMFIPAPANNKGVYTLYLETGSWTIEAFAPGYGSIKTTTGLDQYSVTIAGTDLTSKDFSATGAAQGGIATVAYKTISGTIVDSNNTAVAGAVVYAEEVDTTSGGKTGKGNEAVTNSDGEYTIKVPVNVFGTSTYTIGAKTDSGELTEKAGLDISSASASDQDWSLAEEKAVSIAITGIPAGITLDEVKVEAFNTTTLKGKNATLENKTSSDSTGTSTMLGGTYDVKAYIPGFGQVSPTAGSLTNGNFVVSGATTKTLTFTLPTSIEISGTVKNSSGTVLENAWVSAFDTTNGIGNDTTTDSSGAFTLKVACASSCSYELNAHAAGYLSDKYATAITGNDTNVAIVLGTSDAVITGTVYESDGTTPADDAYVYAVEKDGDKKVEAYPDASGQFTLNLDNDTNWNIFAGADDGSYGTLMNVSSEGSSDAEFDDVTFSLDQTIEGFTQIDPTVETIIPNQGGRVSDEAKNQDMLDALPAVVAAGYTYASIDAADVITIDTIVTIDSGDIGNESNPYTVMIETTPALHSLDSGDVLGMEKVITVLDDDRKIVTDLLSNIDIEMQYDKVDIKNIVDQSDDLTTTNAGAALANLGTSYFDAPTPTTSASDWITTAATKKVKVQATDGGTWAAVDFDTFIDNIDDTDGDGAGFDAYNDFEITIATSMNHLTPLGGILTGTGDVLSPKAPTSLSTSVNPTSTTVSLSWTAPTLNTDDTSLADLQEYVVYRSTTSTVLISGGSEDQRNSSTIATGTTSFSETISGGSGGYTYYYVVTAYDDNGNQSAASNVLTATYTVQGAAPPPSSSTPSTVEDTDTDTDAETTEAETTSGETPVETVTEAAKAFAQKIVTIISEAVEIIKANVVSLLGKLGIIRDLAKEVGSVSKYVNNLIEGDTAVSSDSQYAITNFVTYGTETTLVLGEGERAGVLNSYKSAFNKLPSTEDEWSDAIKIANGRWPSETSETKETEAAGSFMTIYLREPDRENQNDDAAVVVMAYGLRPSNRNLDSEKAAIKIFQDIYDYDPESATDWDIVRAIAYSGASR